MGFFGKDAFDKQKEEVEDRENKATFNWEGRFIAHITNASLRKCGKPGDNLGATQFMVQLKIDKCLEIQGDNAKLKDGSGVLIFQGKVGRIGETVTKMLPKFLGCEISDLTADMADEFVDETINFITVKGTKVHYEGVPCFFDRIREHYTKDGEPKSYVPEGLTRPLTTAECKENGIELSEEVAAVVAMLD
jgi:hypothetical protein